jgi:hypothetical protein
MFSAEEMGHRLSEFGALVEVTSAHSGHWPSLDDAAMRPVETGIRCSQLIAAAWMAALRDKAPILYALPSVCFRKREAVTNGRFRRRQIRLSFVASCLSEPAEITKGPAYSPRFESLYSPRAFSVFHGEYLTKTPNPGCIPGLIWDIHARMSSRETW